MCCSGGRGWCVVVPETSFDDVQYVLLLITLQKLRVEKSESYEVFVRKISVQKMSLKGLAIKAK
jgi:hypothetical protein